MQSEHIENLTKAFIKFQKEMRQPRKNKSVEVKPRNGFTYKWNYSDLDECIGATKDTLLDNGLVVMQSVTKDSFLETKLVHESGEFRSCYMRIPQTEKSSNQEVGSMLTYIRRYSYCCILGIVANDDDDANVADGNSMRDNRQQLKKEDDRKVLTFDDLSDERKMELLMRWLSKRERNANGGKFSISRTLGEAYKVGDSTIERIENMYYDYKVNNSL